MNLITKLSHSYMTRGRHMVHESIFDPYLETYHISMFGDTTSKRTILLERIRGQIRCRLGSSSCPTSDTPDLSSSLEGSQGLPQPPSWPGIGWRQDEEGKNVSHYLNHFYPKENVVFHNEKKEDPSFIIRDTHILLLLSSSNRFLPRRRVHPEVSGPSHSLWVPRLLDRKVSPYVRRESLPP